MPDGRKGFFVDAGGKDGKRHGRTRRTDFTRSATPPPTSWPRRCASLLPGTRIAIGPAIEDGFYYDFDLPRPLKTEDLGQIEERMRGIIAEEPPFRRQVVEPRGGPASCSARSPTSWSSSGTCRRGRRSPCTPRGSSPTCAAARTWPAPASCRPTPSSCCPSPAPTGAATSTTPCSPASTAPPGRARQELADYLKKLEEIEKRDHRRLGRELDLFSTHEEAGRGPDLLAPQGGPHPDHRGGLLAPQALRQRLRGGEHPAHRQELAVGDLRAPGLLRPEHVRARCRSTRPTTTSSR